MKDSKVLLELFKYLGYNEKQTVKILSFNSFQKYTVKYLYLKINQVYAFLLKSGYSEEDIIKMTTLLPSIYDCSIDNLRNKQEFLSNMFTKEEMLKITRKLPALYAVGKDSIMEKMNFFSNLGLSKESVYRISINFPSIFGLSISYLQDKVNLLKSIGFDDNEIVKLIKGAPTIIGYNNQVLINKINNILSLKLSKESILRFPSILELSMENITEKISLYESLGLLDYVIKRPEFLIQSIPLSIGRINFLNDNNIAITGNNLFLKQKRFINAYGITNEQLINEYTKDKRLTKSL